MSSILGNKALIGLGAMLAVKYTGFTPDTDALVTVYLVCLGVQAAMILLMWTVISRKPEGNKFTTKELDNATKKIVVKTTTCREYDMGKIKAQATQLGMGAAITLGMFFYSKFTTPMLMACLQPIFLVLDPLFQIHILGQPSEGDLARPFPNMMADWQIKMVEERDKRLAKEAKLETSTTKKQGKAE